MRHTSSLPNLIHTWGGWRPRPGALYAPPLHIAAANTACRLAATQKKRRVSPAGGVRPRLRK